MTDEQKKYVKYGGIAFILGIVIYYVVKKGDNGGALNDGTGNNGTTPNGGTLPAYVFNAKKVADDLYNAMKEMNTSHDDITIILQHINASQFVQVITAFGRKSYNSTLGNQYNFNPFSSLPLVGLADWLKSELGTKDYGALKLKYPNSL